MADQEVVQTPTPAEEAATAAPEPTPAPSEPLAPPQAGSQTAQTPANEPIASEPPPSPKATDGQGEPIDTAKQAPAAEAQPAETGQEQSATEASVSKESKPAPSPASAGQVQAVPASAAPAPVVASANPVRLARDLLIKARATIQQRKQKKLEKILEFLNTKGKVTNDQVEKLLHVSDATATRYLSALEKSGKIKQVGKTGKAVTYTRI